jgi:hypothetical protein
MTCEAKFDTMGLAMKINSKIIIELVLVAGLVSLAVGWRLINHDLMIMPNLELVTATTLVAAALLRRPMGAVVPVTVMFVSDMLIGNSSVAWFTWSAFLLIGFSGLWLKRFSNRPQKLVLASAGTGLAAGVFFFIWTNFAVWALGDGSFYPHTWAGLMACYAMGLPFFRATLLSGVVLTPVLMATAVYAPKLLKAKQSAFMQV